MINHYKGAFLYYSLINLHQFFPEYNKYAIAQADNSMKVAFYIEWVVVVHVDSGSACKMEYVI